MIHARPAAVARVSLPIRRPRREVFLALTDPDMLGQFWPADAGDAHLDRGVLTSWTLRPGEAPVTVECNEVSPDCLIRLSFSNGVRVMLTLDRFDEGGTVVHYCQCGFGASPDRDDMAGATRAAARMLSDLKALLEGDRTENDHDALRLPNAA